ncbi:MFS transporter [Peribacillus psychrosaccharolyticus]|nr:MFS transporter [Peribacillus psychrosaccharolyticus]MED3745518.1 MFS transporter [Peribacillus psychrosaccharolyticus]
MDSSSIWSKNYLYLCGSNFLIGLMFYMLATILPLYVQVGLHGDEQQMGLVITIYVLGSVFARLFSGFLVDRFGNKKMGVIGFAIFFVASVSYFGVKDGLIVFLIVRFIHGMSYAIASTATNTAVLALLPANRQGEGIGYFGMFLNLAMVIGPSLGLFLWKNENIYIVLIAVSLFSALALWFMLRIRIQKSTQAAPQNPLTWRDIIEVKAFPISIVSFCLFFSYSGLSGFLASYTNELNLSAIAGLFFILYAVMIVGFRPFIAKLLDRYPDQYFFYPSIILFGTGMLVLSQANHAWMVLTAGVMMGFSYGILNPCLQNIAIKQVSITRSGAATATFFLLGDLGYGVGSYCLGLFASLTNYRTMYIGSAIIAFLSIIVYWLFHHRTAAKTVHSL